MASRLDLQSTLESLLGSRQVYYQAPGNGMKYPAIKYSKVRPIVNHANDKKYLSRQRYEIIVMSLTPDHPVINKILELEYSEWVRHYTGEGINHDVIDIYY